MEASAGLGRVVVIDRSEGAPRVVRTVRALAREGLAGAAIAVNLGEPRSSPAAREADEALDADAGALEDALRRLRASTAWIGPGSLASRAAVADACRRAGVAPIGPPTDALAALATPAGAAALAAQVGVPAADPLGLPRGARLVEVAVARDRLGNTRALGTGSVSLRVGDVAALVASPALDGDAELAARALGERVAQAAGWTGVCAVTLAVAPDGAPALAGVDAFPASAPALEEAAGLDLVRLALRLAAGALLDAPPRTRLHAVAARILAIDPSAPGGRIVFGPVELVRLPTEPGVRADAAVAPGDPAPSDGVLATLVASGATRAEATALLEEALADTAVLVQGGATSTAFLRGLCARPEVRAGAPAAVVEAVAAAGEPIVRRRPEVALLASAIASYEAQLDLERERFVAEARRGRPKVGPSSGRLIELRVGDERHRLEVRQTGPDAYRVAPVGAAPVDVRVERLGAHDQRLTWPGGRARVLLSAHGLRQLVQVDGVPHEVLREPAGVVASPMPAVVVAIPVEPGQRVEAGEPVARIESMKVEMIVAAPEPGVVREVLAVANAQVDQGAPLVRLEPLGEAPARAPQRPLALGAPPPGPEAPRDRYLDAVDELRRLVLGFDLTPAEARRVTAGMGELAEVAPPGDPEALAAEDGVLDAFAAVQSLYGRVRPRDAAPDAKPPLEELWRYLHEPERRGAGLSPRFVDALRRALGFYGLSLEEPGRELEIALLRMQKAYERAGGAAPALAGVLERRLQGPGLAPGAAPPSRALLDTLADLGEERFPALADFARELRYRAFDQPVLERVRAETYASAEADLARLAEARGDELEQLVERLVECPQPLATLLVSRMASAGPELRARLVETLLRRYYRARSLERARTADQEGLPVAWVEYAHQGRRVRVAACFARPGRVAEALRPLAHLAAAVPADRDLALEVYVWQEAPVPAPDALAATLLEALRDAAFPRPIRRVSFALAIAGRGLASQGSQLHFTFRGGPEAWAEDRAHRGVHPMLFKRMQLGRLSRFELERLPSAEDLRVYRGVAKENPKDERLFAVAEVRDVTPVRDAAGRVVQLPELERMLHEALAAMHRFQAHRAPTERLEWNRILLTVAPPLELTPEEIHALAERLAPATAGVGLEMVLIDARLPDVATGVLRERLLRVIAGEQGVSVRWDEPTDRPLAPMAEYQQRVVALRRRGLTHPFEIVRMLAPADGAQGDVPRGEFVEHDLDASGALVPVQRPPGQNTANVVVGLARSFTSRHPEGMLRVALLGDPSRAMGSLSEPECRRIEAAILLADRLGAPLEWFAVSAGAKISKESGTENMDWISRVLRRIVEFTQRGGELNVVVCGINVGAQPYWNAEATMLMHTRGILVMAPGSAMVLTGKEALEYSGSVSAEDNPGIGGYERIMGPNGQAQYRAASIGEAIRILLRHYEHTYVAPGERFPRRAATADPYDRDVRASPHGPEGGAGFETIGDLFSADRNPDRKKPFDIRRLMAACVDQDHEPLERWRHLRGGETAVIWDAHLGGWPVCLVGIESRPLARLEFVPADGPSLWSAGTLFPQSSKKIARAVNGASGNRPVVVLANLSGFDGSPESMRRLQLEYGAEIGRAVVNFDGPIVFCVVSRYHGGAFVVFSKALRDDIEVVAVEGARASVIGGAPAAAVVFAREVETRTRKDRRVQDAEAAVQGGGAAARARLADVLTLVRSEKVGEVAEEFDRVHDVERARRVGSLDDIIAARDLRAWLVGAVERGIARTLGR